MKKILFVASALLIAGAATAQNPDMKMNRNYVEINSSADTLVAPNKFRISITISEAPSKGKTTIADLEKSLATALKASGVDIKKQLVITGQSNTDGKRKDIYQYKNYLLTLTEPTMVETVFDELQANGIANASLTQSTRSVPERIAGAGTGESHEECATDRRRTGGCRGTENRQSHCDRSLLFRSRSRCHA